MHKKRTKRQQRAQLVFIYSLMTVAIVAIVAVLILLVLGYRYNRFDGRVEQGGLVQFNSRPTGATVSVDDLELGAKTTSKITLTSGKHSIRMTLDGYNDWHKDVNVKPGSILWLNYTRFFPTQPKVNAVTEAAAISSAAESPDGNWMAFVAAANNPTLHLVRLNSDMPTTTTLAIPTTDYTAASDDSGQTFRVLEWDPDNQSVLLRHDFDGNVEYIVVQLRGDGTAYNLSTKLGVPATKIEYSSSDGNVLYALTTSHELKRINISKSTVSDAIAESVSDFTARNQDFVTYETLADDQGQRSIGYISRGSNSAKTIAKFTLSNDSPLHLTAGNYYTERYLVESRVNQIDILKVLSLPSSDSNGPVSTELVTSINMTASPTNVGFSPGNNRIIYAQAGGTIVTYDLEIGLLSTKELSTAAMSNVTWIDDFHYAAVVNGNLSYYDYDGTNRQIVTSKSLDLPAALTSDGKYLYFFEPNDTNASLTRVKMF